MNKDDWFYAAIGAIAIPAFLIAMLWEHIQNAI